MKQEQKNYYHITGILRLKLFGDEATQEILICL